MQHTQWHEEWRKRPDVCRIRDSLFAWLKLEQQAILEIGPLDRPLLDKGPAYQLKYLDYADTATLRQNITGHPLRNPDAVVELDYVQGERLLSDVVTERFDLIVASHVLEHLPNLLGWLREAAKILKPGGKIFAVYPDRRYTFDLERPATSVGTLLENDLLQRTRPSPAAAFDQYYYHKNVDSNSLWQGYSAHQQKIPRTFPPAQAMHAFQEAHRTYLNCHCNLLDLESLQEALSLSRQFGLQPFQVSRSLPTSKPYLDFIVLLDQSDT